MSSIFLANNSQSLKVRIKLSSSKKTFGNVGISALKTAIAHSRNTNCCPPSNWTREQMTYHWAEFGILSVKLIGEDLNRLPERVWGAHSVTRWSSVADMSNTFWPIVCVVVSSNEIALWSCLLRLFYLGTGRCLARQTVSSILVRMFCRICMFWNTFTAACAVKINKLIGKKHCELYNVVCS